VLEEATGTPSNVQTIGPAGEQIPPAFVVPSFVGFHFNVHILDGFDTKVGVTEE
jgi:hypothetical protein